MNSSEILGLIEYGNPEVYLNGLSDTDKERLYYQQLVYNSNDRLNSVIKRVGYTSDNANNLSNEDLIAIVPLQRTLIGALNGLYNVIRYDETLGFGCDNEYYKAWMETVQSEMEALLDIARERGISVPGVEEEILLEINDEEKETTSAK